MFLYIQNEQNKVNSTIKMLSLRYFNYGTTQLNAAGNRHKDTS